MLQGIRNVDASIERRKIRSSSTPCVGDGARRPLAGYHQASRSNSYQRPSGVGSVASALLSEEYTHCNFGSRKIPFGGAVFATCDSQGGNVAQVTLRHWRRSNSAKSGAASSGRGPASSRGSNICGKSLCAARHYAQRGWQLLRAALPWRHSRYPQQRGSAASCAQRATADTSHLLRYMRRG